ncbi:MAG: hypothetical protein ACJ74Z_22515 [Bryobacteraceae bacterium]
MPLKQDRPGRILINPVQPGEEIRLDPPTPTTPPRTDLGPLKKSYDAYLEKGPRAIREHFEAMKKTRATCLGTPRNPVSSETPKTGP